MVVREKTRRGKERRRKREKRKTRRSRRKRRRRKSTRRRRRRRSVREKRKVFEQVVKHLKGVEEMGGFGRRGGPLGRVDNIVNNK